MENNGALCPAWQDTDIDVCKSCFKRLKCEANRKFSAEYKKRTGVDYIEKVEVSING